MTDGNGVAATLKYLEGQVNRLWESRASKESVKNVEQDVADLKESMRELRNGFRNLQISILAGCVVWALGSAGFIIGVLTLAGGQ